MLWISSFLKILVWILVSSIFVADFMKIMMDLSLIGGSVHQQMITTFFRSTFGLFELIMLFLMIHFIVKYPKRRLRLMSLVAFHYSFVLIFPMAFGDFTWMAVLYPWPQTLLAFDPKTPTVVFGLSLFVGFVAIPFLTFKWGAKGFCGYVCPHGAFYSEAYGRLFHPPPGRLAWMRRHIPLLYFVGMVLASVTIIVAPPTLDPVRRAQKVVFFLTSQMLYLIIGIPLIGARSYCTHFCPLGYEVGLFLKLKKYVGNSF